ADVVEKDQHADDDDNLVGQWLLQQFVTSAIAKQVADDGGDSHNYPQAKLNKGKLHAVQLGARFVGNHPVGGAHESRQHPDDEQVGVDQLGDIEGQDVKQRVRP